MRKTPVVLDTRVVAGSGGGPDKTILSSPRYLESAGYRMMCAYMAAPRDAGFAQLRRKADALQAPLLTVADRGPWDWKVPAQLLNICRRERVAIWHGHDYKSNVLGLLLRRFWNMRLVTTVHGWVHETRRTPLYYAIDRLCLPHYELVFCVSPDLHDQCVAAGVPAERCVLLENGIDTEAYRRRQSVAEAKLRLGLPPERPLVGAVGRLSEEKGFDVLIRATARLLRAGLDIGLAIAGEGDQKRELEELIRTLGHGDRIRLVGFAPDTRPLYESMDVYALSSYREGLPNVLLESMAMEVPVVATNIAGVPRLITHQQNGWLIEPGSVDELAEALTSLLRDGDRRERFRRIGRKTVEEGYSFTRRMDKMRSCYDELLARN